MEDQKKMRTVAIRLRGFRSHVAGSVTQRIVDEYHSILSEVEEASEQNLASFRISSVLLEPRELSEVRRKRSTDCSPQFTEKKYCDRELFHRVLDRLWIWIEERDVELPAHTKLIDREL